MFFSTTFFISSDSRTHLLIHIQPHTPQQNKQEVETGGVTIRTRLGGQLGLYNVDELEAGLTKAVSETKELHQILEVRAEEKEKEDK